MDKGRNRGGKRTTAKRGRTKVGGEVQNDKEAEQMMMLELAEFIFEFGEKYEVLLDVKVKPVKHRKGGIGDDEN